jgi:hypothetical protein
VKTYLRKNQVAERYATTPRTVERMVGDGRIPPAALRNGRTPLWDAAALDAADRAATMRSQPKRAAALSGTSRTP